MQYYYRAARFVGAYKGANVYDALRQRDIAERAVWIMKVRNSDAGIGAIIQQTFLERESMWIVDEENIEKQAELIMDSDVEEAPKRPPQTQLKPRQGQQQQQRVIQQNKKVKTARSMRNGNEICGAYNRSQRTNPCPKGELHVCNRLCSGGRACGLRGHVAADCANKGRVK